MQLNRLMIFRRVSRVRLNKLNLLLYAVNNLGDSPLALGMTRVFYENEEVEETAIRKGF